jgi:xanthine dehydrogenase accessory factor
VGAIPTREKVHRASPSDVLVHSHSPVDIASTVVATVKRCGRRSLMTLTTERITELRAKRRRAAVATLVATTGGAIRRLGEAMWVDDHGAIVGSVTIGGCVDGRAVELAEHVLRSGTSQRVSLPLGDEDAWAFGMTCAGNVDLLIEPVDVMSPDDPVACAADAVSAALRSGHAAIEVVSIGPAPQRLVIVDDGTRHGSLGDDELDTTIAARSGDLIEQRAVGLIDVTGRAGSNQVFVQTHAPPASIIIMGATDVAVALVRLAGPLGYHTTVVDGRDRWANRERFPTADEISVGMPSELIAAMPLVPVSALVLVAHDFKYDLPVLEIALKSRLGYIGVLGSERRARVIRETLSAMGFAERDIDRVRIPVGLPIGARTPAEIALSVLAEVVAMRSGRAPSRGT